MITMFECSESYDRKRPFDHYVRFIVKRRLEDQRRKLYRQNPKVIDDKTDAPSGGKRLFSEISESIQRKAESATTIEPERHYLMKEAQRILLNCFHRLGKTEQMLFAKHELENVSFKKLFKLMPAYNKSFATFKRWYTSEIFDRVRLCVKSQLPD
jgi:DNA-directed RNA polymerase specialized sigma24 family protein